MPGVSLIARGRYWILYLPARVDTSLFGAVSERELGEVVLETIVTSHHPVIGDYQKLLILRPAEALDSTLVPLNAPQELAGTAIDVDGGF